MRVGSFCLRSTKQFESKILITLCVWLDWSKAGSLLPADGQTWTTEPWCCRTRWLTNDMFDFLLCGWSDLSVKTVRATRSWKKDGTNFCSRAVFIIYEDKRKPNKHQALLDRLWWRQFLATFQTHRHWCCLWHLCNHTFKDRDRERSAHMGTTFTFQQNSCCLERHLWTDFTRGSLSGGSISERVLAVCCFWTLYFNGRIWPGKCRGEAERLDWKAWWLFEAVLQHSGALN